MVEFHLVHGRQEARADAGGDPLVHGREPHRHLAAEGQAGAADPGPVDLLHLPEVVDGAHEVVEPLAGQGPAGLIDDVLADVDGDRDVAASGQLGREPLIDARPVVDDEARAAVAVDGHDRGIGRRARQGDRDHRLDPAARRRGELDLLEHVAVALLRRQHPGIERHLRPDLVAHGQQLEEPAAQVFLPGHDRPRRPVRVLHRPQLRRGRVPIGPDREPERLAGLDLQRQLVEVVALDDPGRPLAYRYLVVAGRVRREPLGELVDARIVEGQVHPDAVPRPVETERSRPGPIARQDDLDAAVRKPDRAEPQVVAPRRGGDALGLGQGPHEGGAGRVAVAVPALEDAVGALLAEEELHGLVDPAGRGVGGEAVEEIEGALDGVGIAVGAAVLPVIALVFGDRGERPWPRPRGSAARCRRRRW